jgi:hypothetical protein
LLQLLVLGWVANNGRQYSILTTFATHGNAVAACSAEVPAATLVSIDDELENDFVFSYTSFHSGSDVLWTDFTISAGGTVSRASDAGALAVSDFGGDTSGGVTPYEAGAPSLFSSGGSCVLFVVREGGVNLGKWRDVSCAGTRRVMCERADFTTTTTTTTVSFALCYFPRFASNRLLRSSSTCVPAPLLLLLPIDSHYDHNGEAALAFPFFFPLL